MKGLKEFLAAITISLVIVNCSQSSKDKHIDQELISYHHRLPENSWVKDHENFSKPEYWDTIYAHYSRLLKEKQFDEAALYLIYFGEAKTGTFESDSIYVGVLKEFIKNHENQLSGENLTNIYYNLGLESHAENNLSESSTWFKKAINIASQSKSHKQIQGFSNFALAQNYSLQRDFENAEKHLINALDIFVEVGDIKNQGTVYLLLHNIFMQKSAYIEAEAVLNKGLKILKEQNIPSLIYSAYGLFVHLNVAKADTLTAIKYIDTLAIHAESYQNFPLYHKTILNQLLAFKHIAQREKKEAAEFLKAARELSDESRSADLQMRTLFQELMFAQIFDTPLTNIEEVEEFYNEISQDEDPNQQFLVQLGTALFKYYTLKNEHEKANTYAKALLADKDKALDELVEGKLFELERKFETEQKENKILLQEKKLKSQEMLIFSLVGGAIVLLLIFLVLIILNKNKSIRREKALTDSFTSQLLSKTEDERKRIASDLHDSVSNELINLRHALENNSQSFKNKIDSILEEVRNISRNLSPTLFDRLGLKESVEQLAERAQEQHNFLLTADVTYSGSLNTAVELQLYRIIQEATTNIIKHADAMAGKITLTEDDKYIYAEIKDNGKGFEVERMLEKGNCFGLLNITERTKYINGTVQFTSGASGTTVKITIPK